MKPIFNLASALVLLTMFLLPPSLKAANPDKPVFWIMNDAGTIAHSWTGNDPAQALVMNMQGLKVVLQVHQSVKDGLTYKARFFNVKSDVFNKIMIDMGPESDPELRIDHFVLKTGSPATATFDGMLTFN